MVFITLWSIEIQSNDQSLNMLKYLNVFNAMSLLGIYNNQNKFW